MRLADHSVSLKALPVNALIGLEQTTRFTGGHDFALIYAFRVEEAYWILEIAKKLVAKFAYWHEF